MSNLPKYDQHQEMAAIELFASVLDKAFVEYSDLLFGSPLISDWRRIEVALEGTMAELVQAFDTAGGR
jgi:glucosyl-3-phosphoglycerate synthase